MAEDKICGCEVAEACNLCEPTFQDVLESRIIVLETAIHNARKLTASDPKNMWCRQATIILNDALGRSHADA